MVGSRHLQGTIISRVKHMVDSGSLKQAPVWYDVVRRFPPPPTSLLSLVAQPDKQEIPKFMYPVDDIKREFYVEHFRAARDPTSLFPNVKTPESKTDYFLKQYKTHIDAGEEQEESFQKALTSFNQYLGTLREEKKHFSKSEKVMEHKLGATEHTDEVDLSTSDIYDMFSNRSTTR